MIFLKTDRSIILVVIVTEQYADRSYTIYGERDSTTYVTRSCEQKATEGRDCFISPYSGISGKWNVWKAECLESGISRKGIVLNVDMI